MAYARKASSLTLLNRMLAGSAVIASGFIIYDCANRFSFMRAARHQIEARHTEEDLLAQVAAMKERDQANKDTLDEAMAEYGRQTILEELAAGSTRSLGALAQGWAVSPSEQSGNSKP